MSSEAAKHGHHDDGAVHAHISSPFFYIAVFAALIVLTISTVAQSYVDLGEANIILVILIASLKASLVVTFFMHLKWDNKFHALIFIGSLFFIGVFFAYTLNDTDHRGDLDADQNVKVLPRTGEPAPGGRPKMDEAVEPHPAAEDTSTGEAPPAH